MDFTGWYWVLWLILFFLPVELYAAFATPGRKDTFSEFVWWAFGIKRREEGLPMVRYAFGRRLILAGFMFSLSGHFVFGWSALGVMGFGAAVASVIGYALIKER